MAKTTVIAELGEVIYNIIFSAPSFVSVHEELLGNVIPAIEKSSSKRLLVMGIGPSGSPYYTIPTKFKELFKNKGFKAVFLDYSSNILASCFTRYNELRIIGDNGLDSQVIVPDNNIEVISNAIRSRGFQADVKPRSEFKEKDLEGKLTFFQHDLRDPLSKKLGNYDVVDSTFTLHHAAQYVQILSDRLSEIYDLLDKDGLFHWGTGFCDMSYSEKKIRKIGQKIAKSLGYAVTLVDKRQSDYVYKLTFFPNKEPVLEKANESLDYSNQITIDNDGLVYIPAKFIDKSRFMGYDKDGSFFVFPLIDSQKDKDKKQLIKPVQDFYVPTNNEIANIKSPNPELVSMAVKADLDEKFNALKGLAEYYRSEKEALRLLQDSGFGRIKVKRPNQDGKGFEDLVNILAYK